MSIEVPSSSHAGSHERQAAVDALLERFTDFDPNRSAPADRLPLAVPPFGKEELAAAMGCLLDGWLTMGPEVRAFEAEWAEWMGADHTIMVNSGSSALLVMLSALIETGRLQRGDEVLVPAVGWSTSLFSVAQAGLTPVLVDVDRHSLGLEGSYDRPVLALHLLGSPCRAESPLLLEDACGAHGATIDGAKVGARGLAGTFSFFFSHHITTGEGGAITTNDAEFADACRSLRAHGWVRERTDRTAREADHPHIDPRFLFLSPGFNVRPMEVSGAMGRVQLRRLDDFVARRRANHQQWCALIQDAELPIDVFPELPGTTHAAFGFPMMLREDAPLDRPALCAVLEAKGITTRPISGANLARQPAFDKVPGVRVEGDLSVANAIHDRGLFVGQSHAFDHRHGELLLDALQAAF
ncbi:MAG: DegT/DnrJ/EryC1/StrS aminotransferase [Deltaproteobacteria bacterium]|nr:DegT/DnrJ/EryC1/StrS aminotransferase [Deltaproteobacteria bacterium]